MKNYIFYFSLLMMFFGGNKISAQVQMDSIKAVENPV